MALTLNGRFEGADPPLYGVRGVNLNGREAAVVHPSQSYGFIDVSSETIDSGAFYSSGFSSPDDAQSAYGWRWNHLPSDRHGGAGTIGYLDGHAEQHRWRYTPKRGRENRSPYATEQDLEDARWILRRTAWYHSWLSTEHPELAQ